MNKAKSLIRLGIAWYDSEEQFQAMKAYSSDKEIWEETLEEWLDSAAVREQEIKKSGLTPIRVKITVESFSKWCEKENRLPEASSRSAYIAYLLERSFCNETDEE